MANLNYPFHIRISDFCMFQRQICGGPKIPEMLVAANPDLGATKGVELASISPSFTFIHFHGEVQRSVRQQSQIRFLSNNAKKNVIKNGKNGQANDLR